MSDIDENREIKKEWRKVVYPINLVEDVKKAREGKKN